MMRARFATAVVVFVSALSLYAGVNLLSVPNAFAATITGDATAYASCDGSTTATASGRTVRWGYAANNSLPLGTWVELVRPRVVHGRTWYRIMDRGGPGFVLDIWTNDCAWMHSFGRRTVTFKVVPRSQLYRGKPIKGWKFHRTRKGAALKWHPK